MGRRERTGSYTSCAGRQNAPFPPTEKQIRFYRDLCTELGVTNRPPPSTRREMGLALGRLAKARHRRRNDRCRCPRSVSKTPAELAALRDALRAARPGEYVYRTRRDGRWSEYRTGRR